MILITIFRWGYKPTSKTGGPHPVELVVGFCWYLTSCATSWVAGIQKLCKNWPDVWSLGSQNWMKRTLAGKSVLFPYWFCYGFLYILPTKPIRGTPYCWSSFWWFKQSNTFFSLAKPTLPTKSFKIYRTNPMKHEYVWFLYVNFISNYSKH